VLAQLCEWAEQPWPVTRTKRTPRDGWHLEFLAPGGKKIRNSSGRIGPLIDVRGTGGYVLVAGSVLDGRAYPGDPAAARIVKGGKAYEIDVDIDPVPLPDWLAALASPPPPPIPVARGSCPRPPRGAAGARLRGLVDLVREAQPGDRTGPLVWAAHRVREMAAAGDADPDAAGDLLIQAAVAAGIRGGERYARQQVRHVLGGGR
jgi:Bifunctional DNA primase/polymerase, N-terminal